MKVLLLSDTYSEHTEKWALGLASKGIEVGLFSFNKASYKWYENKKKYFKLCKNYKFFMTFVLCESKPLQF